MKFWKLGLEMMLRQISNLKNVLMNKESKLPFKWMPVEGSKGVWLNSLIDDLSIQNLRSEWLWFRIQTVLSWKFQDVSCSGGCTLKGWGQRALTSSSLPPQFRPGACKGSSGILSQHHRASSPEVATARFIRLTGQTPQDIMGQWRGAAIMVYVQANKKRITSKNLKRETKF